MPQDNSNSSEQKVLNEPEAQAGNTLLVPQMELRVRVAELRGWTEIATNGEDWFGCDTEMNSRRLPDYPSDLNACAEFEKGMTGDECERYNEALVEVTWPNAGKPVKCQAEHYPWFYTAEQRCRAFIATMEEK